MTTTRAAMVEAVREAAVLADFWNNHDMVTALTAAAEALAAEAWRPIETAPKDGTRIWATGLDKNVGPGRHYVETCWEGDSWVDPGADDPSEGEFGYLDYWRPLPPPPEAG